MINIYIFTLKSNKDHQNLLVVREEDVHRHQFGRFVLTEYFIILIFI